VAAVTCEGKETPASAVAAARNRESTGQGAVGEQSKESRALSGRVPRGDRGDRTGESHSISEDVACLRRLVQKVGEARRFFWRTAAMTDGVALSWGQEAAAKQRKKRGEGSESEEPRRVQGRGGAA
jgi:hypothetical protein